MVHYKVSYSHPHRHFISFEARFPSQGKNNLRLQLPAWRPGRYELGNFSKSIRAWESFDDVGNSISYRKINKDLWEVNCEGLSEVVIRYEYYAADLNAGSTFLDESMLYINPVNCFFYDEGNQDQPYQVSLMLPPDYSIACGLEKKSPHILLASTFDELADCPLIASATLKHLEYSVNDVAYHIHIQGDIKLDEERLVKDFTDFTREQVTLFGDIPCEEYHFLFHFTPFFVRHGVEHCNSTVIAMGPAADFQNEDKYHDLLGISCHELFHTWNIKSIRPAEMMPYDFTKENYTRLGYVAEGVTTYYGDYLLWRTGAFSDAEWFEVISDDIQAYMDNPGRLNHSVADSSFDTWLDGYGPGIPWRKVSIYNEGFLIALICDIHIRLHSGGERSLDDVMKRLYEDFGKKKKGYTDVDYMRILNEAAGADLSYIFNTIVYDKRDYKPLLDESLMAVGLILNEVPSPKWSETNLGLFVEESIQKVVVQSVVPGSPADKAGLWNGDEILSLNTVVPYKNFQYLLRMMEGEIEVSFSQKGKIRKTRIVADGKTWALRFFIAADESAGSDALRRKNEWKV